MKRFLASLGFVVVALGVFALTDTASATNGVLDSFTGSYPATAGTSLDNCSTCHTSVPALNAYGSALRAAGMSFAAIESLDSDGDGFSNLQEIRNLTKPGNAADRPATTSSTTTSTTSTTTTTSTTVAPAPQSAVATPTPAPTSAVAPAGATAYDAGAAGTVWLEIADGALVVARIDTSWDFKIEIDDDNDIEVKFRNGEQEIEFEAELEDGTIKIKLEIESDDDGDHGDEDHDSDDDGDDHDDDRDEDHGGREHDDDHERDDD